MRLGSKVWHRGLWGGSASSECEWVVGTVTRGLSLDGRLSEETGRLLLLLERCPLGLLLLLLEQSLLLLLLLEERLLLLLLV